MVTILSSQQITSLMYGASSSFIRFLYVCSSLQRDVQSVYQRTQFMFTFIGICESFNVMNIISVLILRYENAEAKSKLPFILYNACLDPYNVNFSKPLHEVMFFNQIIVYVFDFINIGSNLFLWRYLRKHEVSNTALNVIDKKRQRKRNFVPANVGIFSIFLFFVNAAIFSMIYNQDLFNETYDISARTLCWAFCCDITFCIVIPSVLLYGAPTIRRKWENINILTYFK